MFDRRQSRSRGLPLTFRLLGALLVGSLFLGFVVTWFVQGHELRGQVRDLEARME